jgi:hypothetical protein
VQCGRYWPTSQRSLLAVYFIRWTSEIFQRFSFNYWNNVVLRIEVKAKIRETPYNPALQLLRSNGSTHKLYDRCERPQTRYDARKQRLTSVLKAGLKVWSSDRQLTCTRQPARIVLTSSTRRRWVSSRLQAAVIKTSVPAAFQTNKQTAICWLASYLARKGGWAQYCVPSCLQVVTQTWYTKRSAGGINAYHLITKPYF